jgi:hypothetical protein
MGFGPSVDLFTHGIMDAWGLNPLGCGWVINHYKDMQCVNLTKNEKNEKNIIKNCSRLI